MSSLEAIENVRASEPINAVPRIAVAVWDASEADRRQIVQARVKRAIDVCVALAALLLTLPIVLVAVALICVTSPGSPIFAQARIGRGGRPFTMYKLRTMHLRARATAKPVHLRFDDAVTGPVAKVRHDPRVFPVGRFLRVTSIDELPNLVNVLRGEMSVVGPRPMQAIEIEYCARRYGDEVSASRLAVKPGITGLWQISGRSDMHFDERVRCDVEYAATWTLREDMRIIALTAGAVLLRRGAY